ncbi:GNAT superfamily N-acetyltransferase [Novosphingobium capsulatum]|uniref:GNAT superfamily N-acetyltransferase n=1 Tax=Novosphingobium capsulatum TaxID=13688 RepID=A0ABU1MJN6_9SPHN|nr:GNAT superfamily N-acetyltransferase [Novosphingobium sp. BK256]MBB3375565.1 GNAT superfamily N-acetyltransferase [Novosphingobium sp. BK280]MBB3379726.1 GNAT superfamily N-acetyltransferase [Novosphingobium sp. BK258]MBB3421421.1 GNAT superfamily N-acetyltransferase [Novosphingobium sp. BK267]MBB3449736.1 GNAT superfamily N-acetyltransferase [Novosphingobium sp. BK352]MBB3478839.1 GNAT superfamily N-acetyltransferase [Novosphingobium sp. BK369]MBB3502153.1 GNAT superfamily N-acetyltransfe
MAGEVVITPVANKAERAAFVDLAYRINASDPNWVPPLRMEAMELITPGKNPFFEHADVQLFLARRDGRIVGRISAHIDHLAVAMDPVQGMGPGTGNWGLLEAEDESTAHALIARAEEWLRAKGMTRVLAPLSMSVWEEPGQLTLGFDHPPTVMMGHQSERYQHYIEALPYTPAKQLLTYELDITKQFPPLIQRIVQSGEKNAKIRIRNVDKSKFDSEAAIILDILNDAWSDNWGFVPFTQTEIGYAGKKFKPIVREDLIMVAEYEGEPVAFMMTLPDLNEVMKPMGGKLFPFNWIKLLRWLNKPRCRTMRVPLMGVRKKLQSSRLASQLAFMMIEYIRRNSVQHYGASRGEIGWILDDNQGMIAIADAIDSHVNKRYTIYERAL